MSGTGWRTLTSVGRAPGIDQSLSFRLLFHHKHHEGALTMMYLMGCFARELARNALVCSAAILTATTLCAVGAASAQPTAAGQGVAGDPRLDEIRNSRDAYATQLIARW